MHLDAFGKYLCEKFLREASYEFDEKKKIVVLISDGYKCRLLEPGKEFIKKDTFHNIEIRYNITGMQIIILQYVENKIDVMRKGKYSFSTGSYKNQNNTYEEIIYNIKS